MGIITPRPWAPVVRALGGAAAGTPRPAAAAAAPAGTGTACMAFLTLTLPQGPQRGVWAGRARAPRPVARRGAGAVETRGRRALAGGWARQPPAQRGLLFLMASPRAANLSWDPGFSDNKTARPCRGAQRRAPPLRPSRPHELSARRPRRRARGARAGARRTPPAGSGGAAGAAPARRGARAPSNASFLPPARPLNSSQRRPAHARPTCAP